MAFNYATFSNISREFRVFPIKIDNYSLDGRVAPHVAGTVLLVADLALDPLPVRRGLHDQEPHVVEDVVGSAAAAQDQQVGLVQVELGLPVPRRRLGLRDVRLLPAVG